MYGVVISSCLLFLLADASSLAKVKGSCRESSHYVDQEPLIVNLSQQAGCKLEITTAVDRILAFELVNGFLPQLDGHVKIRNGLDSTSSYISLQDHSKENVNKLIVNADETIYSTGATALVEISNQIPDGYQLKIQKAVTCPFNLGSNSQCGRVVDDVSCYCAVFTKRTWNDQGTFCASKGFRLLSIESLDEETALYDVWGKEARFWTSLNDVTTEGLWIWNSTGVKLYPGYANWDDFMPDNPDGTTDCGVLNWTNGGWKDYACSNLLDALCESQP